MTTDTAQKKASQRMERVVESTGCAGNGLPMESNQRVSTESMRNGVDELQKVLQLYVTCNYFFFTEIFFNSRDVGACPVTTDWNFCDESTTEQQQQEATSYRPNDLWSSE